MPWCYHFVLLPGRLVRQEVTRHMVTVIHNVTRDMDQISCYADNGYGTPMQASRKINISRKYYLVFCYANLVESTARNILRLQVFDLKNSITCHKTLNIVMQKMETRQKMLITNFLTDS